MYDLVIVGAGMIGSAAARHASLIPEDNVCLIGPHESKVRSIEDSRDIFGSHYDESRIAHCIGDGPVWATLYRRSFGIYKHIEMVTGCSTFKRVGFLQVGTRGGDFIESTKKKLDSHVVSIFPTITEVRSEFPYLDFPDSDEFILERETAGYFNPRSIIDCQISLATKYGCDVKKDIVNSVDEVVGENGEQVMKIVTDLGAQYFAKKILLCPGAFVGFRQLVKGKQLDVKIVPVTQALFEVAKLDVDLLRNMPTISYVGNGNCDWWEKFPNGCQPHRPFVVPPTLYPDGKYYLKMGSRHHDRELHDVDQVKRWYCGNGDPETVSGFAHLSNKMFPGIQMKLVRGEGCVVTTTVTKHPFIDLIHPQLGVVTGGNGHAAKAADELGRLAVTLLVHGKWDSELPKDNFKLRYKPKH